MQCLVGTCTGTGTSSRTSESNMNTLSSSSTSTDEDTIESIRMMDGNPTCTVVLRISTRQNHLPRRYKDYVLMNHVMNDIKPLNFEQAKDTKEWVNAMNEEYKSIMKNQTWESI